MTNEAYLKILVILSLSFFTFGSSGLVQAVEVYFTPGSDCENHIVEAVERARIEVLADVFTINNERIMAALIAAHKRGVRVEILTDRGQAENLSSRVMDLLSAGIQLRVHSRIGLEHNAFGVFDDKFAVNGSYNWSEASTAVNSENCAFMDEKNAVGAYLARFQQLWAENTEAKSQDLILQILKKRAIAAQ